MSERGLRARAAALAMALLACAPAGEARAQSGDIEVGPWLGWAAGAEWHDGRERDVAWLNIGLDATGIAGTFAGGYGGDFEVRMGPWVAFELPMDRRPLGEGGLTVILTQTEHASWGSFGLRFGGGYGADLETDLVATLWGGVRFVPARAGQGSGSFVAKATGVRIVATYREALDPVKTSSLVFGIEFEPEYFLPPYSLSKWGGKH